MPTSSRLPGRRLAAVLLTVMVLVAMHAGGAGAQTTARTALRKSYVTRAELDSARVARATECPPEATSTCEFDVALIESRLREGDFQTGDRIVLSVQGEAWLSDTFPVHAGRVLNLPNLPEIQLRGVLRSELQEHLTEQLSRFIKNPVLRSQSLVRVAVLGPVARPGFYAFPTDVPLADALMRAGGPGVDADLGRTEIRRGSRVLWSTRAVAAAVRDGMTIDELGLVAGDQIVVGTRRRHNWPGTIQTLAIVGGLVVTAIGTLGH